MMAASVMIYCETYSASIFIAAEKCAFGVADTDSVVTNETFVVVVSALATAKLHKFVSIYDDKINVVTAKLLSSICDEKLIYWTTKLPLTLTFLKCSKFGARKIQVSDVKSTPLRGFRRIIPLPPPPHPPPPLPPALHPHLPPSHSPQVSDDKGIHPSHKMLALRVWHLWHCPKSLVPKAGPLVAVILWGIV